MNFNAQYQLATTNMIQQNAMKVKDTFSVSVNSFTWIRF